MVHRPGWLSLAEAYDQPVAPDRRHRTPYEGASIVFASVIILFALIGIVKTLLDGEGPGSSGFLIGLLFLALGAGRLYLGLRGGASESERRATPPRRPPARRGGLPRPPRR